MIAVIFLPGVRIASVASLVERSQQLLALPQGSGSSPPLGADLPGKPSSFDATETYPQSVSGAIMHAAMWPKDSSGHYHKEFQEILCLVTQCLSALQEQGSGSSQPGSKEYVLRQAYINHRNPFPPSYRVWNIGIVSS